MPLDRLLLNQIVDVLVPYMTDIGQRKALVALAVGDLKLVQEIEWAGSARAFAVHLVTTLDQWGESEGTNPLEMLLTTLSSQVGGDIQETVRDLMAQIPATRSVRWDEPPFPGLQAFQERHEPIFFGRELEVHRLAEMVQRHPLVAVVGASGSGKSSLIQAGVIPRLKQLQANQWQWVRFTPDQAGLKHPFASLRTVLGQLRQDVDLPSPDELAETPTLLRDMLAAWLPETQQILLLVDQFEETFTTIQPGLRAPFIQALCQTLDLHNLHVVLTLRSDFSDHCINEPDLAGRMYQSMYPLSRPHPWMLHQMIVGPARIARLTLDDGLIDALLTDTGSEPGNLALLAYTLDELYKIAAVRKDRRIQFDDYQALGGVQGAIGKRAEQAFDKLTLENKEALLPHVFRELVDVDDRGTATRKRAPRAHFPEAEDKLVSAFVKARLLVSDEGWVEVAHEALFRSWERLRDWIAMAQEDLILLRQVSNAAHDWDRKDRPDYLLWPDERLSQVDEMKARLHPTLSDVEKAFLRSEVERLSEEFRADEREYQRLWIIDRWAKIGERAVDAMIACLGVNLESSDMMQAVAGALKPYVTNVIDDVTQYLTSKDDYIRDQCAFILGVLSDPRAVPALIQALKDKDWEVRMRVVETLSILNDPGAVPALIQTLRDENEEVRQLVAQALGVLGDPRAIPSLIEALKDEDNNIREYVFEALVRLHNPQTVSSLIEGLENNDDNIRWNVAEVLGRLGDPQAVPALINALRDKNANVRRNAANALGELGDVRAVPVLIDILKNKNADFRQSIINALGKLGDVRAVPALIDALADKNESARRGAVVALGKLDASQAVPALIDVLEDQDKDVRRKVADVLGQLRDPRAVPGLIEALKDGDTLVRRNVAEALGKLRDPQARSALMNALKDQDISVRERAADALGRLRDR